MCVCVCKYKQVLYTLVRLSLSAEAVSVCSSLSIKGILITDSRVKHLCRCAYDDKHGGCRTVIPRCHFDEH